MSTRQLVPKPKEVLRHGISSAAFTHQDWIGTHNGEHHHLSVAVFKLRHKYLLSGLTQCPRETQSIGESSLYCTVWDEWYTRIGRTEKLVD